jgi:hypothetical protein
MTIRFWSRESWMNGIYDCVTRGLTFEAHEPGCGFATWEITLTGGY